MKIVHVQGGWLGSKPLTQFLPLDVVLSTHYVVANICQDITPGVSNVLPYYPASVFQNAMFFVEGFTSLLFLYKQFRPE